MKRQITLVSALLAGSALAQTTATTTIGEVTLTKPVAAPAPAELSDPVEAAPAQEAADQSTTETAPAAEQAAVTEGTEEAATEEADTQETLETAPAQPVQPVTPPSSAAAPAPARTTATPAVRPVTPPAAQPAAKPTAQPVAAPKGQGAPQATTPAAAPKPAVTTAAPAMPTAATAKATPTQAPSDLPAGWRHLSGDIFGSKLVALPAGSKVQVAIEAVNRATGLHTPHLLVDFSAESLPTGYYINYNPGRMNTAKYDYVIQAKVFDADGDMLYMSDARQPLPRDVAAKLKIDMRF